MAQDGRAVIAAIIASFLIGFVRLASVDSACLHCVGNVEVSPFRHYFRSTEGEHQPPVKGRVNTLEKDQTVDGDPVKSCTSMCIALAQDGPTGKLLEKYLPESISKLSSWLKSFVEDSFMVDNKTNSIRRKRDARYDATPEDYDFVELDDYLEEKLIAGEDFPDWDDSVSLMKALSERFNRRHHMRQYGKPDKPKPRSDCLARQQELLMEVMNVFDQIAEKATEELQRMLQEEFDREMSELEPFKVPMWWIIGLQQNNLILPYLYKEKIQPETPQEAYTLQPQPSPIPKSSATRDPQVSTSRASAVAIAMDDSVFTSWYPYQQPDDQSWYAYQDTIPSQSWYPYQDTPSNQQIWYSPNNNAWYASSPDGSAQVSMSGSQGQPVYVAEDGNKIVMVTPSGTTPPPAYAPKPEKTTGKVPKPMGFPETTPVPMTDGLPETKPILTGVMVQQTEAPQTTPKVGNPQQTTPVPETGLPQTTPQITGGMSNMAQPAAGNTEVPQTTPKVGNAQQTTPIPITTELPQTTPKADAASISESESQQTTPKMETTPVPVTESPQTTPKIENAQETTLAPETTGITQTTPVPVTTGSPKTTSLPETTGLPQTTPMIGGMSNKPKPGPDIPTTPKSVAENVPETGPPQTSPKAENTQETTPIPQTTPKAGAANLPESGLQQTTPKMEAINTQETTPIPVTTDSPQTTPKDENTQETTTPVPETTGSPQTTPKMFGGMFNKPSPSPNATTTPKTTPANTQKSTPRVPDGLSTQTGNTTSALTSHRSKATTHPYPTTTTVKQYDETATPTDSTEESTQSADETDSDVSTRGLPRFNDEVTQPDCNGASPTKRFLPAILKVLKLKAK